MLTSYSRQNSDLRAKNLWMAFRCFHHSSCVCAMATTTRILLVLCCCAALACASPAWSKGWLMRGGAANYTLVSEETLFSSWRTVVLRRVQLPHIDTTIDFEVVGQKGSDQAVLIFCWNSSSQTCTLVREYMPAKLQSALGLAAGMVEGNDGWIQAARRELAEEARLQGGDWYQLCVPTVIDKYATTKLTAFLVVDPTAIPVEEHPARDESEHGMEVVENVSVAELYEYLEAAEFTVVGGWAVQLALNKLRELGQVP